MLDYEKFPVGLRGGLQRWVEIGMMPGDFVTAVLENDLTEAALRADHKNVMYLGEIAKVAYFELPRGCRGSPEIVREWQASGGLEGQAAAVEVE